MFPHWCGNWITTCCRRQLRRRDLVGWPRRDSPVLRKVKGSGSCTSARVGHPAGVAGRGNKRCAAGKPSRAIVRAAGEFSGSLTGGPRAPHLEASVIHGGLLCIYLEVRPVAHRLTPSPQAAVSCSSESPRRRNDRRGLRVHWQSGRIYNGHLYGLRVVLPCIFPIRKIGLALHFFSRQPLVTLVKKKVVSHMHRW